MGISFKQNLASRIVKIESLAFKDVQQPAAFQRQLLGAKVKQKNRPKAQISAKYHIQLLLESFQGTKCNNRLLLSCSKLCLHTFLLKDVFNDSSC